MKSIRTKFKIRKQGEKMTDITLIFEIGKGEILKRIKEIEIGYKDQRFLLEQRHGNNKISDVSYNNCAYPKIKLEKILVTKYAVKDERGYELRYEFIGNDKSFDMGIKLANLLLEILQKHCDKTRIKVIDVDGNEVYAEFVEWY